MTQLVREPTRNEYLLELLISDVPKVSASFLHSTAGHKAVLIKIPLPKNVEARVSRTVWCLQKTDWKKLEVELTDFDLGN